MGTPWSGAFVNANGDLTADLRSNIAAESRAKMVYEYLMQFTDDPLVKDTLRFLMTREVAHFQMFEAALADIKPNFPPGILQSDPRFSNAYFNMSKGEEARGPWNKGESPEFGEEWQYIADPQQHVKETNGLVDRKPEGTDRTEESVKEHNVELGKERRAEVDSANPKTEPICWNNYPGDSKKG